MASADLFHGSRRAFLGQAAWALSLAASWPWGRSAAAEAPPEVVVARGGGLDDRLRAVLAPFGGIGRFVRAGSRVVIKPNAAFGEGPETGGNTTPEVVAAVVRACQQAKAARILVVEHCLSGAGLFGTANDLSGITQAAQAGGAELVDTGEKEDQYLALQLGAPDSPAHPISRPVLEADVVINLPRLKIHPYAGYTMSIKNLMGVMHRPDAVHQGTWLKLPEWLSCLGRALQPYVALSLIDATDKVEGWAAGEPGKLTRLDTLIAGTSMVSVDAVGVSLCGQDPLAKWACAAGDSYLRVAHEAGWGNASLNQIKLKRIDL